MNVMEKAESSTTKRRGRPLSFDRDEVLEKAMLQFWRTGYETTSVADLTLAMGITAPSLYTAFGDKESLFLECLRRYATPGPKSTQEVILEAPSAREAARNLLEGSARWFTQPGSPAGCLIASAASSGSKDSLEVRAAMKKIREEIRDALGERAQRDIDAGRLPATANPCALSAMTIAMVQGMSTLARDGVNQADLISAVHAFMVAWPER